jgi:integrase
LEQGFGKFPEPLLLSAWPDFECFGTDVDLDKRIAFLLITQNGESRGVPLSSRALAALRVLPSSYNGRVFGGLTADALKLSFKRALRRAGIEGLRLHDLRHEATSRFFEKGLSVMEVASVTGHKTLQMLRRYTHLSAATSRRGSVDAVAKTQPFG